MADVKFNFVLMGKSGQGKSATGNMVLDKNHFKTSFSALPETHEVDYSVRTFGNYLLLVVDEPGLDVSMSKVKDKINAETHMKEALSMCVEGIVAFLFVLKFGNRFTAEDKAALDDLKLMFGYSFLNHLIVVMTGGDLYQRHIQEEGRDISFHDWCKQQVGEFRQLYEECEGRFVLFNNIEKDKKKKDAQIQELIQLAQGIRVRHDRYTSQCFLNAQRVREKLIRELQAREISKGIQDNTRLVTSDKIKKLEVKINLLLMGKTGHGKSATGNSLLNRRYFKVPARTTSDTQKTQNTEIKLNVLLMGKTGEGKSATGNSLLNRKYFKTAAKTTSVTQDISFSFSQFEKYILLVVDGPGLADTIINKTESQLASDAAEQAQVSMNRATEVTVATENMNAAIAMCYGGVDVFMFVTKFGGRFTGEDMCALKTLKSIFGSSYINHVIVVVTCGDLFNGAMEEEETDISFHEWCKQQKGEFKELYEDCKGRFVLINNRETDEKKKLAQIQEIVQTAHDLHNRNGRYTSQCFQDAEKGREKLIVHLKAPQLSRDIQEKVSLLTADIHKLAQNYSESQKEKIKARSEDLMLEIDAQDKGYGVLDNMKELAVQVREHIDDVAKLQSLAKDLEKIRTSKIVYTVLAGALAVVGVAAIIAAAPISVPVIAGAAVIGAIGLALGGTNYGVHSFIQSDIENESSVLKNKRKM